MSQISSAQLLAAAIYFAPAFIWTVVAQNGWRFLRTRRPRGEFFRLLPILGGLAALIYWVITVRYLLPPSLHDATVRWLDLLNDSLLFIALGVGRHTARFFPTPEEPSPGRAWLTLNYGSSVLMVALCILFHSHQTPLLFETQMPYRIIRMLYQFVMIGLMLEVLVRTARPGAWRPGGALFARRADVVMVASGLLGIGVTFGFIGTTGLVPQRWAFLLDLVVSLALVAPLAIRILGEVVRKFVIAVVMFAATAGVYFGMRALRAAAGTTELDSLLGLFTVVALVLVLVPGQLWLRAAIDHVLFRRSRRRREELQAFLHNVSPEPGALECCRRVLPEVVRVMQLRGAAILLPDDQSVAHGGITVASVEETWRRAGCADAFPARALVGYELRALPEPLKEALSDTDIVAMLPIISPRQRWGLLLISTGLLGASFSDEDMQTLDAFCDQLARVLDAAELLNRAVAVQRSLAHTEKLAAIGELAARIAHEIRNPVTAARSLAQQLSREPASPLNTEHAGLILAELERVERQVAALLRFARREQFHFQPLDLSELVRTTVAEFHARLDAAGVAVEEDVSSGIIARVDREKVRQVLVNLLENAMDALTEVNGARRLAVAVGAANGTATLQVSDSGPGVPADALPQLFEPFFSLKAKGTGLGLAIAKRTVDAHGGHIEAVSPAGLGMTFRSDLPLAGGGGGNG